MKLITATGCLGLYLPMSETQNQSWLGSLINTIIGNLKLSVSNIHIRYEDHESNHGHPFAAAVTLEKLSAFTVDDSGKETFATGGALDQIQKVSIGFMSLFILSNEQTINLFDTSRYFLPSCSQEKMTNWNGFQ